MYFSLSRGTPEPPSSFPRAFRSIVIGLMGVSNSSSWPKAELVEAKSRRRSRTFYRNDTPIVVLVRSESTCGFALLNDLGFAEVDKSSSWFLPELPVQDQVQIFGGRDFDGLFGEPPLQHRQLFLCSGRVSAPEEGVRKRRVANSKNQER